jgi:hypothetical protein
MGKKKNDSAARRPSWFQIEPLKVHFGQARYYAVVPLTSTCFPTRPRQTASPCNWISRARLGRDPVQHGTRLAVVLVQATKL